MSCTALHLIFYVRSSPRTTFLDTRHGTPLLDNRGARSRFSISFFRLVKPLGHKGQCGNHIRKSGRYPHNQAPKLLILKRCESHSAVLE